MDVITRDKESVTSADVRWSDTIIAAGGKEVRVAELLP